jgi:hypothetical protein
MSPFSEISVFEVVFPDEKDFDPVRRWIVQSIRSGDGLILEQSRYFLVFPGLSEDNANVIQSRIQRGVLNLGAKLELRPRAEDPVAESLCRRAEARIIPVEPRSP